MKVLNISTFTPISLTVPHGSPVFTECLTSVVLDSSFEFLLLLDAQWYSVPVDGAILNLNIQMPSIYLTVLESDNMTDRHSNSLVIEVSGTGT